MNLPSLLLLNAIISFLDQVTFFPENSSDQSSDLSYSQWNFIWIIIWPCWNLLTEDDLLPRFRWIRHTTSKLLLLRERILETLSGHIAELFSMFFQPIDLEICNLPVIDSPQRRASQAPWHRRLKRSKCTVVIATLTTGYLGLGASKALQQWKGCSI